MTKGQKITLWLGFLGYGLALFAVLTFYRLPADRLLTKAVAAATGGKVHVSAEKVSASLWRGYRFENLTWTFQSGGAAASERMEWLTLSPGFLGLVRGYLPVDMEGALAKGTFQLRAGASMIRGLSNGYATLRAEGIHVEELAALTQIAQREIKGKLTGQAEFYGALNELKKISGRAGILFEDGAVDTRVETFGLRTIPFERLSLPLTVQNGVATLKGGQLVGPVLEGELEGQIRLLPNLQVSPIQITATMRPGPSLTGGKEGGLPRSADKPFVIQLQGTIGKPLFTLAGG
jgi:type II secretion system protein N